MQGSKLFTYTDEVITNTSFIWLSDLLICLFDLLGMQLWGLASSTSKFFFTFMGLRMNDIQTGDLMPGAF